MKKTWQIIFLALTAFLILKYRKSKSGSTVFTSSGIKIDYPLIDPEKNEVTAYITHNGKTYMRVQYNALTGQTQVKGSVESIKLHPLVKNKIDLKDDEYIEMVQMNARFLLENQIDDPNFTF